MRMTFGSTVSAVPHLGNICSSALTSGDIPGSGLRIMRLVNRQLRIAMLEVVQGYTLHLHGRTTDLLDQINLLESTRLSQLRVVVTDDADGR